MTAHPATVTVHSGAVRGRRARVIVGPIQSLTPIALTQRQQSYLRVRRWIDAIFAGLGLLAAALPMLAVAVGVMMTMGRPVLFTQQRMTQDGRIFRLRKFRSMRTATPDGFNDDAARLVPFGRFLRASSLDELPSLWNVVKGDMSLVGPRPLTTDYYGRFSAEQFARHTVPAGLTGYAQVHGRNTLGWDDRFTMDREYVARVGPLLDLRILLATVTTVLSRQGVTDGSSVTMADFPGPLSTTELALEGPGAEGTWVCRDREGRSVLEGSALLLEGQVVQLGLRFGPQGPGAPPEILDEAVLLLASHLRVKLQAEWGFLALGSELPEDLAAALARAGYVTPSAAVRFPTQGKLPVALLDGTAPLIAFLGLPEEGFARHCPTCNDPKVRTE